MESSSRNTDKTIIRGFWWLTYYLFARHLPRSNVRYSFFSRQIRAFVLKKLLGQVGQNVNVEPKVIFYNMSESEIGDNSGIGMCSYIGTVRIGRNVMIGEELAVISTNHEFSDVETPMREQGFTGDRPVTIEDNVWIGTRVILLPGVRIGTGSIVGAGSVVTKDIPPYSVVVGNPACVVRSRI
jgi:maltose O-acetyltransferase